MLSDILDGYFPYDLKTKYPDGVPLKPIDMVDETYNANLRQDPKFRVLADLDGLNPMTKKEFLNQFPESKIKDGNVVPIREELEKRFQETNKFIDVNKLNSNEPISVQTDLDETSAEVVTLRVRTETGKRTILVKLSQSDPIAKVYKYVRPYAEEGKTAKFELRTNFPNKAYVESDSKSLKELGLAPSCALIMKPLK